MRRYDPLFVTGVYGSIGTAVLVAYGCAAGAGPLILWPLVPDPGVLWWFFGEIVLGLSIFSQMAWSWALPRLGPTLASIIGLYGSVLVGVAGALIILHETISPIGYVAAALLVVALGLAVVPTGTFARTPPRADQQPRRA
jgi:drug/metabolite transporter (DMT)-like permease